VTEEQWLACPDSQTMLSFLNGRGGGRRARLFAAACCRSIQHLMSDERSRRAIEAAERYGEGVIGEPKLLDAHNEAAAVFNAAWDARESAWDACNATGAVDPVGFEAAVRLDSAAYEARQTPKESRLAPMRAQGVSPTDGETRAGPQPQRRLEGGK
jgi:hypothetical protein